MKTEFSFNNSFNDVLIGNKWEIDNPKANIILITGMNEYSLRYDDFSIFLNNYNYNVYCIDHYGQFKNGSLGIPPKNYFFKMEETVKEFAISLKSSRDIPIYIFAHSMGSFICQGLIENYSDYFDKIILCGTSGKTILYKIGYIISLIIVNKYNYSKKAKLLHNLSIGLYNAKFKKEGLSARLTRNKSVVDRYNHDNFCNYRPSNGFYKEFFKGLSSLYNKKKLQNVNKNLKILIIGGENDPVSNQAKGLKKLNDLYRNYSINSRLIVYKDMRHEIINELENENVYDDIKNFYDE